MAIQVIDIKCPNCNATIETSQPICKYCKQPVTVSTFNSIFSMDTIDAQRNSSAYGQAVQIDPNDALLNNMLAMYFLRLGVYDEAASAFNKAMSNTVDYSETYFYAAIAQLRGKKAFVAQKADIERAETYIQAALRIEPKAIYNYLWAYIKYDYYERKCLNTNPPYVTLLKSANEAGLSPFDVEQLFLVLNVAKPEAL
jgi:tetratricopeptide (TPR) repeat protein